MTLRNVVVMLILAGLAVLAWFTLDPSGKKNGGTIPATLPQGFEKGAATKVVARNADAKVIFRRRTDRSDAWEVEVGTATVRADAASVEDLLTALQRQGVRQKLDRKVIGDDLSGFGLADPAISIEVTTPGKTHLLRYGKKSMSGETIYVDEGPGTDVWSVDAGLEHEIVNVVAKGGLAKRLTDLRLFDLGAVEIVKGGVTTFQAERDPSGIWRVKVPYKGFAVPNEIEKMLSKLVNVEVVEWPDIGAQDLTKSGLDAPRGEVVLSRKQGGEPAVILLGKDEPDGKVSFAMEKGVPNVAYVPLDFAKAAMTDPLSLRDHNFPRIGMDGNAIRFRFGDLSYELAKEGSSWDITKPEPRLPGDDRAIRELLEAIRGWTTVEFDDQAKPEERGIDGTRFVEIDLAGGGKTILEIGSDATGGTYWARRRSAEGDGGVERVDGTIIAKLRQGYAQFRRKIVRDFEPYADQIRRIEREPGKSEEGAKIQPIVLTRDVSEGAKDPSWKTTEGPGLDGKPDFTAIHDVFVELKTIEARGWRLVSTEQFPELGFNPPFADFMTITVHFDETKGTVLKGDVQRMFIGKKLEGGGRWAMFAADEGWAFVLSDADAEALAVPLVK